jgi:hypothetical protein
MKAVSQLVTARRTRRLRDERAGWLKENAHHDRTAIPDCREVPLQHILG